MRSGPYDEGNSSLCAPSTHPSIPRFANALCERDDTQITAAVVNTMPVSRLDPKFPPWWRRTTARLPAMTFGFWLLVRSGPRA